MSGDMLRRPLNAPASAPALPGTQPGVSTGITVAHYVIVYGVGGGVFVYNGIPGLGTLVYSITVASEDPYGNATVPGFTTYVAGALAVSLQGANIVVHTGPGPGGPWTLASNVAFYAAGVTFFGQLIATSGTAAEPSVIETDTWQAVTPPAGTSGTLQYRMTPDQQVDVVCQLAVTTAVSATNPLTLITLPPNYTPAETTRGSVGYFINGTPTLANLQALCDMRWSADPAGTITIRGWVGGAANTGVTELDFAIRYPLSAASPPPAGATRSQYTWPFTWDSIWNLPISTSATYAATGITVTSDYSTQLDACEANSTLPTYPVKTLANSYVGAVQVFCNPVMTGNGLWNSTAAFLAQADSDTIWQGQTLQLTAGGNPDFGGDATYLIPGVSITNSVGIIGAHGGSYLSCLGGTLTIADLTLGNTIQHAMKLLFNNYYAYYGGGTGYQWPASNADSGYNTPGNPNYYGGSNVHVVMGALLALPPTINPLTRYSDPLVQQIATAMQNYGAYIVDSTAQGVGVYGSVIEMNFDAVSYFTGTVNFKPNFYLMLEDLEVVTNSTAATPGGGAIGTGRLAPFAPPFSYVAKLATLIDSFATNDLPALWGGTYGTVTWSAGQVAIKCDTSYDSGLQSTSKYDLTSSAVYAHVAPYLATSSATSIQLIANAANNIFCGQSGADFVVYKTVAGVASSLFSTTYSATSHAWWRMRESAGTVYVDTAPDGVTWTNQFSFSDSSLGFPLTMVEVLFQAGDYGSDPAGTSYVYAVGTTI